MHKWMNEQINQWMIDRFQGVRMNEWMNGCMNTRINKTMKLLMLEIKTRMNERTNEYIKNWTISCSKNERMNEYTNAWNNEEI